MNADRWADEFIGLACSDCDPELWDDDDRRAREQAGEPIYEKGFVFAIPKDEDVPDYCPRCGNYLSVAVDEDSLTIHGHLLERWTKRREEEAAASADG